MRILLAITSSISAYKSPMLVRELIKNGHSVICALSKNASKLVSKKSLETVSENPVITNMWRDRDPLKHISVNKDTDVLLIAPATANIIGKIANGICDDSISTIAAAFKGRKFFAPAMNPEMWNNKAVQRNVDFMVNSLGYTLIEPEEGIVACKDIGRGRLASIENILSSLKLEEKLTEKYSAAKFTVSSGATIEWIDTIRYITNNSSGKMGFALYSEIINNGGTCNYVEGKVNSELNNRDKIKVETTEDMKNKILELLPKTDILIMAAAPLDFKPVNRAENKLKKTNVSSIELSYTDDILLATKNKKNSKSVIVAFASESASSDEELKNYATSKMFYKDADMIVANKISESVGLDTNKITIFYKDGRSEIFDTMSKNKCASVIVDSAYKLWLAKNKVN